MFRCTVSSLVLLIVTSTAGFPDGAPVDACVKPRPNQPYHGQARSQPPQTNPYAVVASGNQYGPGSQIQVTIHGEVFRGFFIQARDVATDQWVGTWEKTPNTNIHPECSSITHGDPRDKQQATLIWNAPHNVQPGQVYFTGTVLKDYGTFWAGLVAQVAQSNLPTAHQYQRV